MYRIGICDDGKEVCEELKNILVPLMAITLSLCGCGSEAAAEIVETVVTDKDYYEENNWNKTVVYETRADLTHDGIEERIVTVLYAADDMTAKEPSEMLYEHADGYLWVYEGSTGKGEEDFGALLWEESFSAAHAGNTQVNLVWRDGQAYLLTTDIYAIMEQYEFGYEVLYLDAEGNTYTVAEKHLYYETDTDEQKVFSEEEMQEIVAFKTELQSWFEEAVLLVAADAALEEQLVSTPDRQYAPQEYYDIVMQRLPFGNE